MVPIEAIPLQGLTDSVALGVFGTVVSFAVFLSLTAHIAARNVLGDVPIRNALLVGPVPAGIAVALVGLGVNSFLTLALAVVADGLMIRFVYGGPPRLAAYVTTIHFVVSVILGTIVFGVLAIYASAPV